MHYRDRAGVLAQVLQINKLIVLSVRLKGQKSRVKGQELK